MTTAEAQQDTSFDIPTLRLGAFTRGDEASRRSFVEALRRAGRYPGVFYLADHGVSADLRGRLLRHAQAFFALPEADKLALRMVHSPHFRGYTAAGDELTGGTPDWREQIDFGDERPPIPGASSDTAEPWRRLQGPNLWPAALPELRDTVLEWHHALTRVGLSLIRALALALGQHEDRFDAAFSPDPVRRSKLIRYPGRCSTGSAQGVGAHKDSGFLTLLLQQPDRPGLQVLRETGPGGPARWVNVPPRAGTLVVNLGEALEMLSGGYLRATVHRVPSPPACTGRLSVAFFLSPRLDAELPAIRLPDRLAAEVRAERPDPANPLLAHAGRNLLKGRLRSHRDVALRHYADVLQDVAAPAER